MKPDNKTVNFFFIFTLLYILPLLLINNYYMDDTIRSIIGYGWEHDGRNLSTYILQLFSFGSKSVDLFPYSIISAALILALSGYYITKILRIEQHQQLKFSGLILLTNPFMLGNLSYRWDSLPMSISIICSIIPFLYISSYKKFIPISIICILITLFTYQASAVIYVLMTICLIITSCIKKTTKNIIHIIIMSALSLIITYILYMIIVKYCHIDFSSRTASIFKSSDPIELLMRNLNSSVEVIIKIFNLPFKLLFFTTVILFVVSFVKFSYSNRKTRYKILALILILMIPLVIIFILIASLYPTILPRVLVGSSLFVYSLLIFINWYSEKLCKYISIGFLVISFPLMAVYANSLKNQNLFEKYIVDDVFVKVDTNNKYIFFDGIEPWAPELENAINNFPIISDLVPRYMNNNWPWGRTFFMKSTYLSDTRLLISNDKYNQWIENKESVPLIDKNINYCIRSNDSVVIIDFK